MFSNTPVATHRIRQTQTQGRAPSGYLPSNPLRRVTTASNSNRDVNAVPLGESANNARVSKAISAAVDSPPPSLSRYMETHSTTIGLFGTETANETMQRSPVNFDESDEFQQPLSTGSPGAFRRYRGTPLHAPRPHTLQEYSTDSTRDFGMFFFVRCSLLTNEIRFPKCWAIYS